MLRDFSGGLFVLQKFCQLESVRQIAIDTAITNKMRKL